MKHHDLDRKFWSVSWLVLFAAIVIAGAIIHLTTDLGFWGSTLPPLVIVVVYLLAVTAYLRYRHRRKD